MINFRHGLRHFASFSMVYHDRKHVKTMWKFEFCVFPWNIQVFRSKLSLHYYLTCWKRFRHHLEHLGPQKWRFLDVHTTMSKKLWKVLFWFLTSVVFWQFLPTELRTLLLNVAFSVLKIVTLYLEAGNFSLWPCWLERPP